MKQGGFFIINMLDMAVYTNSTLSDTVQNILQKQS